MAATVMPIMSNNSTIQETVQRIQLLSNFQPTKKRLSWSNRKAYVSCQSSPLLFASSRTKTYHNAHSGNLANNHHGQKTSAHLPASFSIASSSQQHNSKSDKSGQLQDDREVHQEAYASPHGAEVSVFAMAVFRNREGCATRGERGAAAVQTIGHVDWRRGMSRIGRGRDGAGVRDPVGEGHRGECQGDGCGEHDQRLIQARKLKRKKQTHLLERPKGLCHRPFVASCLLKDRRDRVDC